MKWLNRFLLLFIIGFLIYVVASRGGLYDLWRIKKNIAQAEQKNNALLNEKNQLAEQINLLISDKFYIEKIAREELGMAKKGDVIIYFDRNPASQPPLVQHSNNKNN
ncbi:MAG: FtsB family cell division protein [bacterium]